MKFLEKYNRLGGIGSDDEGNGCCIVTIIILAIITVVGGLVAVGFLFFWPSGNEESSVNEESGTEARKRGERQRGS